MNLVTADAICQAILDHHTFVISTHINPDGDAIGSQLALYSFLLRPGKSVQMVNRDPVPANFRFLPHADQITQSPPSQAPEVLFVLDAGDLTRIGESLVEPLQPRHLILNIDHHAHASEFGDQNLIVPEACATSEILYSLFRRWAPRVGISEHAAIGLKRALCLYTGIMYDTGCFRYSNATPEAHRVAAALIAEGVAVDVVYEQVYENVPERKVRLLSEVLPTLRLTADGRCAHIHVTRKMMETYGAIDEDLDGFINQVRMIEGVEVALLFSESTSGEAKASLRSRGGVDVGAIAAEFGGGGHARAAGCKFQTDLAHAQEQLIRRIEKAFLRK